MADKTELRARLEYWQEILRGLRAAFIALLDGGAKSYTIGDRSLTKFDIPTLKKEIEDAEKKVDELNNQLKGIKPRRAFGVVPKNW